METMFPERKACIDNCLACYSECLSTAVMRIAGNDISHGHFTLMMACAEVCRTSAQLMLIGSPHHRHVCRDCAKSAVSAQMNARRSVPCRPVRTFAEDVRAAASWLSSYRH